MIIEIKDLPNQKIKNLSVNITFEDEMISGNDVITFNDSKQNDEIKQKHTMHDVDGTNGAENVIQTDDEESVKDDSNERPIIPDLKDRGSVPIPNEMTDLVL